MAIAFASGNVRAKYKVAHTYICTGIYNDAKSARDGISYSFSSEKPALHTECRWCRDELRSDDLLE